MHFLVIDVCHNFFFLSVLRYLFFFVSERQKLFLLGVFLFFHFLVQADDPVLVIHFFLPLHSETAASSISSCSFLSLPFSKLIQSLNSLTLIWTWSMLLLYARMYVRIF